MGGEANTMRSMRAVAVLCLAVLWGCNPDPYPTEEGKILHIGLRLLPKSIDPPQISDEGSGLLASQVYEGLLMYHPFARPYQLMPAVAAELPEISEDKLTYTFRLKQGVRFADDDCFPGGEGREVTAHDFLYAFKRFSHPNTRAKGWWLFDGKIAGLNDWREKLEADIEVARTGGEDIATDALWGLDQPVAGFEVVDDYTLRFHLTEPYPQFLWVLAMSYTAVYPHEAVERYGDEFRNNPVGTGPFRLTEFNPVYRAIYTRNENYREERFPDPVARPEDRWLGWEEDEAAGLLLDAGATLPLLDGVEVRFILEDQPRWLYFKSGFIDFLNPPKDNTSEAVPRGALSPELTERGVQLRSVTELGTVYTCLNIEDELLSNVGVRRAIALAYDHKWTVDNLYSGQAVVATSLIPQGVAGFINYHPYHGDDGVAQPGRAREMLAAAGYPGGIDPVSGDQLRLRFENSGTSVTARHFADRFTDEMRRIGIEVDVIVNTFPQMIEKMRTKNFQVAGLAWGFDYPDAQNILQLLYGPNKSPGINAANFDNAEFNALYEQISTMEDGPERTALYEEMSKIVSDEVPWVTRAHRIRQNLQQPWLENFKYTGVHDQYMRYADIDLERRERQVAEWNRPVRWPLLVALGVFLGLVAVTIISGRERS
ncbi:MAG: oligopeptide transport system substrate-binding protein [Myxococcota bacterium]